MREALALRSVGQGPRATDSEDATTLPARPRGAARLLPERVAVYTLEAELGQGGMGAVYRARGLDGGAVALKLLHDPRPSVGFRRRFAREVAALTIVRHANVVRLVDAGLFEGRPWLAMELVDGADLAATVAQEGPLPWARVIAILRQLASALGAVHAQGLVHRDVKPRNVALTKEGSVKLLDFGLAVHAVERGDGERLTAPGSLLGTPGYMPPEALTDGPDAIDARSDRYAFALTALFLLTGRDPLRPADVACEADFHRATQRAFADAEARGPLPTSVRAMLERCLSFDPRQRPSSTRALVDALA